MAYKRKDSSLWQVRRRSLPGFGDTGVLSTGVRSKRVAERMERTLEELAERALLEASYRAILDAVVDKRVDLATLQRYHAAGDLATLRTSLSDPPLADVVQSFRARGGVDDGVLQGLDLLLALTPRRATLSHLRSGRTVVELCRSAETPAPTTAERAAAKAAGEPVSRGRTRNTVRRTLLRAISMLVRHELGEAVRTEVFADVRYSATDDTREVLVTTDEIARLLDACDAASDAEMRTFVWLALVTSADRGVLVAGPRARGGDAPGLQVRQVRIMADGPAGAEAYSGEVFLNDTKTAKRQRTVPLTDALCRALLPMCAGKAENDQVFAMAYSQVSFRWNRVRRAAGLPGLRIKDLRAQSAIYGERAGVPLTVMAQSMGHADEAMTRRYQRHKAVMTGEQASGIEREMGLTG